MLPSQFLSLDVNERAFVIAAINIKIEKEKEEAKKMKAQSRKGRRK
jgi:hypothetical protein